jgi:hypothetical protein
LKSRVKKKITNQTLPYEEKVILTELKKKFLETENPLEKRIYEDRIKQITSPRHITTIRDLLTPEEKEKVDDLQLKLVRAKTPIGVFFANISINKIIRNVKERYGLSI